MKNKIAATLPNDKHTLTEINSPEIHIADWKDFDSAKGIEVSDKRPTINSVFLLNNTSITVIVDIFGENALPTTKGKQARQCECIAFPADFSCEDWILTVETKYAKDYTAAFRKERNYPENMIEQIISTVDYFRDKKIIAETKLVHAIISFPNLIADFNSTLFSLVREEWSVENLIVNRKIRIKGCNSAKIISEKRLKFITI